MRRSPLKRTGTLARRSPLRARPKRVNRTDPARMLWKEPTSGFCQCGQCNRWTHHLARHHIVYEQHLRAEGRTDVLYDLRNALLLHEVCHAAHHSAVRRIPISSLPDRALEFASEVLGPDRAFLYLARHYAVEVSGEEWRP